jgi:type IV pilus assembly protein PilN
MIKINLLPRKVTRKKMTVIRHIALGSVLLAVYLALLGYIWFDNKGKINALQARVALAEQEKEKLKNVNQEKEQHQKSIDDLKRRIDVITQIEKGRLLPIRVLDDLTKILDEKMPVWLERFNLNPNGQIIIDGFAFTNDDLSNLLQRLEASDYLKNVTLIFSQVNKLQGRDVFRFSLTAEMETPQGG